MMRRSYLALYLLATLAVSVAADPFHCAGSHCYLQGDGTYPNVVVGTIRHLGKNQESQRMFLWARHHGWWKSLLGDAPAFASHVQPVLLATQGPHGRMLFTGLMGEDEYSLAPLHEGDFVRYSPHDAQHPSPPENTPAAWAYWRLVGCIQVLCRAGDKACEKAYRPGFYLHDSGQEFDVATGKPLARGTPIDPITYRVK